ncbi:MAG: Sua5/YciO/YrdC/YwlC family protein [Phycisphaerae bacterium]
METRVIKVRRPSEAAAAAQDGARTLETDGIVGFATETVYGLAALATSAAAMERLRELKSRPARPFSVHIGRRDDIGRYVASIPPQARRLIAGAMPGPVTILLPVGGKLADAELQRRRLYHVLCDNDVIGLRCPDEPVAAMMLAAVSDPVVAPSANMAGGPSPRTAQDVLDAFDGRIELLIDSGPTRHGKDSTIVSFAPKDVGGSALGWSVVRKGVYDERMIRRLMRRKILFVCSGNTCRSPIAAGIARKLLAKREGCDAADLKKNGIEVGSAGLYAMEGGRASPEAVDAAGRMGADISRHRSRMLTSELINDADVVFCMTDFHVAQARRLAPSAAGKVRRLDDRGDISDPIGGGVGVYRKTAERIERALEALLDKGTL